MTQKKLVILILVTLLAGFFGWQWVIELQAEEPRRAIVSIEMMLTGNYIVPQINDVTYYNKPPVFNWLMIGFFYLFGSSSEWVVRLPSLLSLLAMCGLNYVFVKRLINPKTALYSSLFLLTSADILLYGSMNSGEIDLFYSLVVYLQAMAIFVYSQKKEYLKLFLVSYLLTTIGFLTKGLPSLAFQALTLISVFLYHRKFWLLFGWQHILGLLSFVGLMSSYLYLYSLQDDVLGFLVRQFKEASQRTGLETSWVTSTLSLVEFPFQLAKLVLPWSLLAVFFFKKGFRAKVKENPFLTFSALFLLVNIILYWTSGDFKARYLYMFLPFICVFLAHFYFEFLESSPKLNRIINGFFSFIIFLFPILFIAMAFVPDTFNLNYFWLRLAVMLLLSGVLIYLHFKSSFKLLHIIIWMAFARIGFNMFYLPTLQNSDSMYYRDAISEVLEITGEKPIYLLGQPHTFKSDASIGPLTFEEVTLETAPLIAYQIPYYITSQTGHILKYVDQPISENYHIIPIQFLDKDKYQVLHTFEDRWQQNTMALIRP